MHTHEDLAAVRTDEGRAVLPVEEIDDHRVVALHMALPLLFSNFFVWSTSVLW